MNEQLRITVQTGIKSAYTFIKKIVGTREIVDVETNGAHQYYCFGGAKPTTAIVRLVERAAELERFYLDVCELAVIDDASGKMVAVIERDEADEESLEEAYDRVAQMVEEQRFNDFVNRP